METPWWIRCQIPCKSIWTLLWRAPRMIDLTKPLTLRHLTTHQHSRCRDRPFQNKKWVSQLFWKKSLTGLIMRRYRIKWRVRERYLRGKITALWWLIIAGKRRTIADRYKIKVLNPVLTLRKCERRSKWPVCKTALLVTLISVWKTTTSTKQL